MQHSTTSGNPVRQRTACAIVGAFADAPLSPTAQAFDEATGGLIAQLLKNRDFRGRLGETQLLAAPEGLAADKLLLVGCGNAAKYGPEAYRTALVCAVRRLATTQTPDALWTLSCDPVPGLDAYALGRQSAEHAAAALYRFDELKSNREPAPALRKWTLALPNRGDANRAAEGQQIGAGVAAGVSLARDWSNRPANLCTPQDLARAAQTLAGRHAKVSAQILNEAAMRKLGMGALLAVSQGSVQPPRLIVLLYRGASARQAPVALVGKAITFDTGGISIKPAEAMDEMKFDKSGGTAVLGTIEALATLKAKINVIGLIPACENMPGGAATRPGDVVTSLSGKTVEILNTDAEGRLILCDALTYARRFKPDTVIDMATLTGACVIALGGRYTGVFSHDDALATELIASGERTGDLAWRLPVHESYGEGLASNFADMANIGGREGGASIAAAFLSRFTEGLRWAHLDIAGSAWKRGAEKGATGRPVSLLTDYLLARQA